MSDKFNEGWNEIETGQSESVPGAADIFGLGELEEYRSQQIVVRDQNDIQRHDDGTMTYKRFVMTAVGMMIPEEVDEPEWADVGNVLKDLDSSISWNLGDWAAFANGRWGKEYKDIAKDFGYESDTLKVYASIARSMPTLIRNQRLSFAHHRLISRLKNRELQIAWLAYADFFQQRLVDMRRDMSLLAAYKDAPAIEWLMHAMQNNKRLWDFEELNPSKDVFNDSDPLPNLASEITLLRSNAEYIANEYSRFDKLSGESKRSFIEHLDYFVSSAQKIREIVSKRLK